MKDKPKLSEWEACPKQHSSVAAHVLDCNGAATLVPIQLDIPTLSWNAKCETCNEVLFMLADVDACTGPRRDSGSSALLPVTMSIRHECFGAESKETP